MRDEMEREEMEFQSMKKRKRIKAFIPEKEVQETQASSDNPSPLDDFFEMPAPVNEPEPAKEDSFLSMVSKICIDNNLPFISGRCFFPVGNIQPDLVCKDKLIALEVYDPRRTPLEVTFRVKALHHYGFKVQLITADDLLRPDARERCARIIRSLLK